MTKNQHRTIYAVTVVIWTFAVTLCRAIRMPNDFSEAHWLLDYRFGFMKRGLIGSICALITNAFGTNMTPMLIAVMSVIMLCCMSVAMLSLLVRAFWRQQMRMDVFVFGVVFASSPFVVISAHLNGYFDALLYFFAIASILLVFRGQPLFASVLSSLAILTHESYLLVGLPLVCLASIGVLTANTKRASRWYYHIIAIIIPIAVFLAASLLQGLTTDAMLLRAQLFNHLESFGFVPTRSEGVAIWQTTSFIEFFRTQHGAFGGRLLSPVIIASVGPTLLAMLVFIHTCYRIRAFSPFSVALLGAVCSPLAMHAVAWDTPRISSYTIGGGFIAWWILSETRTAQQADDSFLLIALPVLVFNILGHIPLMDGQVERFSVAVRILLYLPALSLLTQAVVANQGEYWLKEFIHKGVPNKAMDSDEE